MKRWPLRILLCVILITGGAITTVAVAWGCAARIPMDATWVFRTVLSEGSWRPLRDLGLGTRGFVSVQEWRRFGSIRVHVSAGEFHLAPAPKDESGGSPLDECPPWCRDRVLQSLSDAGPESFAMEGRGWPLYALWCEPAEKTDRFGDHPAVGGFAIDERLAAASDRFTKPTLPLVPIWPGFAIDTLFYAAKWGAMWFGFASAKRAIRRKRGRCPRCGYDLRGDLAAGCSECGWGRGQEGAMVTSFED